MFSPVFVCPGRRWKGWEGLGGGRHKPQRDLYPPNVAHQGHARRQNSRVSSATKHRHSQRTIVLLVVREQSCYSWQTNNDFPRKAGFSVHVPQPLTVLSFDRKELPSEFSV